MRKIFIPLVLLNLILMVLIAGGFYLSEIHPFRPGDPYYSLQDYSEQWRLRLLDDDQYAFELAERRLVDLARAESHVRIDLAAISFNRALDQLLVQADAAPQSQQIAVQRNLYRLFSQADLVIAALKDDCEVVAALGETVTALLEPTSNAIVENDSAYHAASVSLEIDSTIISFLGQDVDHDIYPLVGAHEAIDCTLCHYKGQYVGTYTQCNDCHQATVQRPVQEDGVFLALATTNVYASAQIYQEHFDGECQDCHSEESWEPVAFNHEGVFECRSCHAEDQPSPESEVYAQHNQYSLMCVRCHADTEDWAVISFSHQGVYTCTSCHDYDTPENHYEGACDRCHTDTGDWLTLNFDHTGYADCATCHQTTDHYTGDCQSCHTNTGNWYVYDFSHNGMTDCRSCHEKPTGHYTGQCSDCHLTSNWNNVSFNHARFPNCQDCHTSANHYTSSCQNCHTTFDWGNISVDHNRFPDCLSCHTEDAPDDHYDAICSQCHDTNYWNNAAFDHAGFTDCLGCHAAPDGHYEGQCSNCHVDSSWDNWVFDHAGFVDCVGCHTAPEEHYDGQCSNCHTVTDWDEITFDHEGYNFCGDCHEAPDGHWPGQCQRCHTDTSDWSDYVFDHTGYNDCKSCHTRPDDHKERGQCSKCHNTESWEIPLIHQNPTENGVIVESIQRNPNSSEKADVINKFEIVQGQK